MPYTALIFLYFFEINFHKVCISIYIGAKEDGECKKVQSTFINKNYQSFPLTQLLPKREQKQLAVINPKIIFSFKAYFEKC